MARCIAQVAHLLLTNISDFNTHFTNSHVPRDSVAADHMRNTNPIPNSWHMRPIRTQRPTNGVLRPLNRIIVYQNILRSRTTSPDYALNAINIYCLVTNDLLLTCLDSEGYFGDSADKLNSVNFMPREMLNNKCTDIFALIRTS